MDLLGLGTFGASVGGVTLKYGGEFMDVKHIILLCLKSILQIELVYLEVISMAWVTVIRKMLRNRIQSFRLL